MVSLREELLLELGAKTRTSWDGPRLPDAMFTLALGMAKKNADLATDNAQATYADCTR